MSEMKIHSSLLNGIANAIRNKTNTTARLSLAQIREAIANYPNNILSENGNTELNDTTNAMLRIDGDILTGFANAIRSVNGESALMTPEQMINAINNFSSEREFEDITFADATYEELRRMLEAHYAGEIDIADYWSIGDTKTIELTDSVDGSATGIMSQNVNIVIVGLNHHDLSSVNGIRSKAALTLHTEQCLVSGNIYLKGTPKASYQGDRWSNLYIRNTTLSKTFKSCMPAELDVLVKNIRNPCFMKDPDDRSTIWSGIVTDKYFLPSVPEIFGRNNSIVNLHYVDSDVSDAYKEGTQLPYYTNSSNRRKNNNYFLRSGLVTQVADGILWGGVNTSGALWLVSGYDWSGLAPMFCL